MIIYAETVRDFLEDVDLNRLERRLVDGFERQTGSVPADRSVWANEYARFSNALRRARVDDDMQVAIEYHVSAAGRSRIDVLLAGNDGERDTCLVLELKAWSEADVSDIPELVWSPYGGGTLAHTGATTDFSPRFAQATGTAYNVDVDGSPVTWATGLTSTGGSLRKGGSGSLALGAANTFPGGVTPQDPTGHVCFSKPARRPIASISTRQFCLMEERRTRLSPARSCLPGHA